MQIIQKNAQAILFEKASHISTGSTNSWRCIYINLCSYRFRHNHTLLKHFFAKAVKTLLADTDGDIFLCPDGDIFILFQGQARPMIDILAQHFDGIELGEDNQPKDSMFTVLDLSTDWQVFYHLCLAKSRQHVPVWQQAAAAQHDYA